MLSTSFTCTGSPAVGVDFAESSTMSICIVWILLVFWPWLKVNIQAKTPRQSVSTKEIAILAICYPCPTPKHDIGPVRTDSCRFQSSSSNLLASLDQSGAIAVWDLVCNEESSTIEGIQITAGTPLRTEGGSLITQNL